MTWTRLTQPDGRPWAVVDGDTLDAPQPYVWCRFKTAEQAWTAATAECPFPSFVVKHMPRRQPMKYAPARDDGQFPYVVTNSSPWPSANWRQIRWALSLADAKLHHGHTRERHNYRSVRRATPADMAEMGDGMKVFTR